MQDRVPCEFFLFRYVPDVVKGEFINIGVLLREAESAAAANVRFTKDWSRVRCLDPGADVALLEAIEQEVAARLRSGIETGTLVATLQASMSNSIQVTDAQATLAENVATELDQLMRLYIEPLAVPRPARNAPKTGRPAIQAAMRTEFERAGVWPLMNKRLAAERYTRAGDPLRIDCGYRKGAASSPAAIRMFQAVSLDGDVEMAKVLAFAADQMREGVARIENAELELTAVVEPLRLVAGQDGEDDEKDEAHDRYRFGVETLEQRAIRVVTLSDLARVAATARHELGL